MAKPISIKSYLYRGQTEVQSKIFFKHNHSMKEMYYYHDKSMHVFAKEKL